MAAAPPYESVVEGRATSGEYFRLSAHGNRAESICWDLHIGRGGAGDSLGAVCKPGREWGVNWAAGSGFAQVWGYVGVDTAEIQVVWRDGLSEFLPVSYREGMGASFFVFWVQCGIPDIERLRVLDDRAKEVSRLRFPEGVPSEIC